MRAQKAAVRARLEDNLDLRGAMDATLDLVRGVNRYLEGKAAEAGAASGIGQVRIQAVEAARAAVQAVASLLGLDYGGGGGGEAFSSGGGAGASDAAASAGVVDALVSFRDSVRALARGLPGPDRASVMTLCDALRDGTLLDLGYKLEDRPSAPSVWSKGDPGVMRRERDEALLKAASDKHAARARELDKWEAAARDPRGVLAAERDAKGAGPKYGAVDEAGIPTQDAAGKPLGDKARKAAEKAMGVLVAAHAKLGEKPEGFLEGLRKEVEELAAAVAALQVKLR